MSKPVVRRPRAAEDVEWHAQYIANDNIDAAVRFLDKAEATINRLGQFPASGAPFHTTNERLAKVRTKLVSGFPNYVVFYIEHDDAVEVIRLLRAGQDMTEEL